MKKLVVEWNSYNSIQDMPQDIREKYFKESKSNVLDALWDADIKTPISSGSQNQAKNSSYSQKTISQVLDTFDQKDAENKSQINSLLNEKHIEILKEDIQDNNIQHNSHNSDNLINSVYWKNTSISNFLYNFIVSVKLFYSESKYKFLLIIFILFIIFIILFMIL